MNLDFFKELENNFGNSEVKEIIDKFENGKIERYLKLPAAKIPSKYKDEDIIFQYKQDGKIKVREDLKDKTILISSHGAAVRALLSNIEKCDIAHFWGKGVHKNCGVSCVELINGEYQILWENRIYY